MLNIAVKAARQAAAIINSASQDLGAIKIRSMTYNDFVCEVDHAAERAIIETLLDAYPDHSILAEEGGRMVILTTDWNSREACLQHHASRLNRQFVAETQDLLVGSYVVKLFQNQTERRCP